MPIELKLKLGQAKQQVRQIAFEQLQETFEIDIKTQAVENSPVTAEGILRNQLLEAQHKLGGRPVGGTGTNRRSIDTEVVEGGRGPEAKIFSQSGYGGYLEVGTSKMSAQPYVYPAFQQHVPKVASGIKAKVKALRKEQQ